MSTKDTKPPSPESPLGATPQMSKKRWRLTTLLDNWGQRIRRIGKLEARAAATRVAAYDKKGVRPPLVLRLARLLDQLDAERGHEQKVIGEIVSLENHHRQMRHKGRLRRAMSVMYGKKNTEELESDVLRRRTKELDEDFETEKNQQRKAEEKRRKRFLYWLYMLLFIMLFWSNRSPQPTPTTATSKRTLRNG